MTQLPSNAHFPHLQMPLHDLDQHFDILHVESTPNKQELLDECYSLRHQVFFEEFPVGFDKTKVPPTREFDEHDAYSQHILLRHKPTGTFVGTARLISGSVERALPVVEHFAVSPDMKSLFTQPDAAEVSRLSISKGRLSQTSRKYVPFPAAALCAGIVKCALENGIWRLVSIMEPILNALLWQYHFQMQQIAPVANCFGKRAAYYTEVGTLASRLQREQKGVWKLIQHPWALF